LLVKALARAHGRSWEEDAIKGLEARHDVLFREYSSLQQPLPGTVDLLRFLRDANIAHGIATTGKRSEIEGALRALGIEESTIVVDGSSASHAKPEPDLFVKCQRSLKVEKPDCLIIGDAVWDIHAGRRAGILAVGLLTGGCGEQELSNAGAMRVYRDAQELLLSIDELGLELP
jgi:HAD superfamily hydrolase (TIGR01549 family)